MQQTISIAICQLVRRKTQSYMWFLTKFGVEIMDQKGVILN